jgi:hypothetical protein
MEDGAGVAYLPTMRRSHGSRAFLVLLAIWFAVYSAAPGALHACPMHDGGLALPGIDPAPHAMAHAGHSPLHHGAHSHAAGHVCSCPGPCDGAEHAVDVPRVALTIVATLTPSRPADRPDEPLARRPASPEHARPPSLGPPTLHAG